MFIFYVLFVIYEKMNYLCIMKRTHRASYSVAGQADGPSPFHFFISVTMTSAMTQMNDIQLYHGDCLGIMPTLADGSVDMILTDLPYGCLNRGNEHAQWDRELPLDALWGQWKRIAKPNAAVVLFGQGLFSAKLMMSQPKMYRYSLVWDKVLKNGFLNANRMPLKQHEDILVFYRSMPTYNPQMAKCEPHKRNHSRGDLKTQKNRCYGNFVATPTIVTDEKYPASIVSVAKKHIKGQAYHPTEKPVALLEYLIRTYTNEGDTVLDCTMGSGSTMVACANINRKGVGIELIEEYYNIAVRRVREAVPQPKLDLLGVASSDPSNP